MWIVGAGGSQELAAFVDALAQTAEGDGTRMIANTVVLLFSECTIRHELEALVRDRVRPADIAVLSLAGQTKSRLRALDRLGTIPLARADAPDAAHHVVADTFLRFKGLERPFVVVTELVQGPRMNYDTRMHIALTRATAGVIVVCDQAAVDADGRLQALRARAAA